MPLRSVWLRGWMQVSAWREAAAAADITTSEATAHRLRRRVRQEGDAALPSHRQGVAYKLPPAVRQWLVSYCQEHAHGPPAVCSRPPCVSTAMSSSASLPQPGSRRPRRELSALVPGEKSLAPSVDEASAWQDGAGSLLLLAAAHESGLIAALQQALPVAPPAHPFWAPRSASPARPPL